MASRSKGFDALMTPQTLRSLADDLRFDSMPAKFRWSLEWAADEIERSRGALMTAVGHSDYYARRAGYLEGGLMVIANGGVDDPVAGAASLLESVGEDEVAKRLEAPNGR